MWRKTGPLAPRGVFLSDVEVDLSPQHASSLLRRSSPPPRPVTALALIDTGTQRTAIDIAIVGALGLPPVNWARIHTASTTGTAVRKPLYDVKISIQDDLGNPHSFVVEVLGLDLASQRIDMLIGWDILAKGILGCDGPARSFTLTIP